MLWKLSKHTECNFVIVIKYAKTLKCLSPFLTTTLMTTCKPEKPSKGSNKIYQLFARIPHNSYFEKYLKIWCQGFPGRNLLWGSTSANLDAVTQQIFKKKNYNTIFCLEFSEFFHNIHKEKLLVNNSENIKYKC